MAKKKAGTKSMDTTPCLGNPGSSEVSGCDICYQAIFEQSVDPILLLDMAGNFIRFNTAAHRNLGYTRDEFSSLNIADIDEIESPKDVRQHIEAIARNGHDSFRTRHVTKSGQIREVFVTTQAVSVGEGASFVSMWHDMTDHENAVKALEQKNAALLEMVDQIHAVRDQIGREVRHNLETIILPMMDELTSDVSPKAMRRLVAIRNGLAELLTPFATMLSGVDGLTPRELRICHLIRSGNSTKQIAELEHVTPATVSKHRENIRRKLGINGKDVNLCGYLNDFLSDSPRL
jgi:PAS domain S-box-containing protein